MEGMERDDGDLKIGVFVDKLDALKAALQETDRLVNCAEKLTTEYLVSDLSHSSPAAVTLKASPLNSGYVNQSEIFDYFSELVRQVTSGVTNDNVRSYFLLEKINDLCAGFGDKVQRMWLSDGKKTLATFNETTKQNVLILLGHTMHTYGSVTGKVERYNSHGDSKYFYIYPMLGGRVKCIFGEEFQNQASDAVEKMVTVTGKLSYRVNDFFPFEVIVADIESNHTNPQSSSLSSLVGSAPDATGDQSSVDFVNERRDGWH